MKHLENKMVLFSIIWKKLAKSHIYQFVMESMILKCTHMNKYMTIAYCLSQNNFCWGYVFPGTSGQIYIGEFLHKSVPE